MVRITVIADNTVVTPAPQGLRGEWGFSAVVDDVLFDTGQSETAARNARLLGLPAHYEAIVLSHAHGDHTAGLQPFLDPGEQPTIYCHPDLWRPRYTTAFPGGGALPSPVHVGVPYTREHVESGAEVVTHTEPVEVAPGIHALGEIPREHVETTVGKIEVDGELVDDPVVDDRALAVETDDGLALVLGCCHSGLRNTIEHAESITGETVRHVVGGTHLVAMDAEGVHDLADWLDGRLDTFGGTHCTGFAAQSILAERLPEAFEPVGVGSRLEIGE